MPGATQDSDSIPAQILQQLLASLIQHPEFDDTTIENLRRLIRSGDIQKAAQVSKAIKAEQGGDREAS